VTPTLVALMALVAAYGVASAPVVSAQSQAVYEAAGPYRVETVESITIEDDQRERDVVTHVRYPIGDGPFPVIVFSHGLGANKDVFGMVTTHWASHGFVTIHPSHDDRGVGMTGGGMHPSEEKVRERVRDVTAVLDGLDQIERSIGDLAGKLDRTRMAVGGHSYGSFTTMAAGGVTIDIGDEIGANLGDPRVQCILPISPSGRGDYGLSDSSWDSLTMPAMVFVGTNDVRNGRAEDWRTEPYLLSPSGSKYLINIDDATHNAYSGDGAPGDAPTYVKAASAAFWDSCLNGSAEAEQYLTGETGFRRFIEGEATFSFK
jgi:predicted dienelactone hydrolase